MTSATLSLNNDTHLLCLILVPLCTSHFANEIIQAVCRSTASNALRSGEDFKILSDSTFSQNQLFLYLPVVQRFYLECLPQNPNSALVISRLVKIFIKQFLELPAPVILNSGIIWVLSLNKFTNCGKYSVPGQ